MAKKPTATSIPSLDDIEETGSTLDLTEEVTLSLDISGSCIGWALGVNRELVTYGKHVFKGPATIGEKLYSFEDLINTLLGAYRPSVLVLEEPLKRAKVRSHFEFLGVLRVLWRHYCGEDIPPDNLIDPRKVKKLLHVQPGRNHKENKKRMVQKINQMYGLNLAFQPNSALQSDDDIADAIAVLATHWRLHGPYAT